MRIINLGRTGSKYTRPLYSNFFLKIASAAFLLACFLILKESTGETRKNVFYLTSKALFVLKKIKV